MTEQPQPDDVADALTRLEEQVTSLHDEVKRLGATSGLPPAPGDLPPSAASYAWVGAVDAPVRRRPQLPRLVLEALFLAAAAAAAAIADLDPVAIAGVMVGAWVLVALIEWAASRADLRQEYLAYAPAPATPAGADPAWFSPPVEHTLLEPGATDSVTEVTRLPPPVDEAEETIEHRPAV